MKYAVAERERRFLLDGVPADLPEARLIEDRYVDGTGLRLRRVTHPDGSVERKLTHKRRGDDGPRTVWCTNLYLDQTEWDHLAALGGLPLRKRRSLLGDAPVVAVDVFEGALSGLVLAEVDRGEAPDDPALTDRLHDLGLAVVREVTDEEPLTGAALARRVRDDDTRVGAAPAGLLLRPWSDGDAAEYAAVHAEVAAAGDTYALDPATDPVAFWTGGAEHVVVAEDADGTLLGTARMGPNRPGAGAHVGTASLMVATAARGRGVGRALGAYAVAWLRDHGYAAVQFNAVVETNRAAVDLWHSLGFRTLTTLPGAFTLPDGTRTGLHVMWLDLDA